MTKKRVLTKGNDDKGTKKTTLKSLNIATLKTLKTFTEPFTWEVETDITYSDKKANVQQCIGKKRGKTSKHQL